MAPSRTTATSFGLIPAVAAQLPRLYGSRVRPPIDIAIMFAALWLLGLMVLDYLTPKELTVYMIAAATAPAVIGTGLCYYLRFPPIDFMLILTTLWLEIGRA